VKHDLAGVLKYIGLNFHPHPSPVTPQTWHLPYQSGVAVVWIPTFIEWAVSSSFTFQSYRDYVNSFLVGPIRHRSSRRRFSWRNGISYFYISNAMKNSFKTQKTLKSGLFKTNKTLHFFIKKIFKKHIKNIYSYSARRVLSNHVVKKRKNIAWILDYSHRTTDLFFN
jgi:hypothetical protein